MLRFLVIGILLFSQSLNMAEETPGISLGMWSWSQTSFDTAEARDKMLRFCAEEGISHIDQHVSVTKMGERYVIKNAKALEKLLIAAANQGISINALRGERTMFFEEHHAQTIEQLQAIISFNQMLPKRSRLAGVKYDVEPYLTKQWKEGGVARKKVIHDYLSFLAQARALLAKQSPDLDLCVDIPFWWDKPELEFRMSGKDQLLVHHIIDLTDWIGIMSYRREATDIIRLTKSELDYAKKKGKKRAISPAISTAAHNKDEDWTTFEGSSIAHLRTTLEELERKLSVNKAARLIMIHDYKSLKKFLQNAPKK